MSQERDTTEFQYEDTESADGAPADAERSDSVSAPDLTLLEGERVLVDAQPTWWNWAVHLVGAGLAVLFGLLLGFIVGAEIAILAIPVGLVIGGYVWYRRNRTRYLITDRRIVVVTGFSARKTTETWIEDVRGLQTSTTAFSRHLGYGTITVSHRVISQGFGRTKGLQLPGVPAYTDVADAIRQRQSERKAGRR